MKGYTYKDNLSKIDYCFPFAIDIYKDNKYVRTERFMSEKSQFSYIRKHDLIR